MKKERDNFFLNEKVKKTLPKVLAVIKLLVLAGIILGIPSYMYVYHKDWLTMLKDVDEFKEVVRHSFNGPLVVLSAQIIQIIIAFIPGQGIQMATGYIYGLGVSIVFSVVGAVIGETIAFAIGRALGYDGLRIIVPGGMIDKYVDRLGAKKSLRIVFILYLLPGFPKDLINYVAGISNLRLSAFLISATIARTPAMIGSILIGTFLDSKRYYLVAVIGVISIILFFIGMKYRKKLDAFIDETLGDNISITNKPKG